MLVDMLVGVECGCGTGLVKAGDEVRCPNSACEAFKGDHREHTHATSHVAIGEWWNAANGKVCPSCTKRAKDGDGCVDPFHSRA